MNSGKGKKLCRMNDLCVSLCFLLVSCISYACKVPWSENSCIVIDQFSVVESVDELWVGGSDQKLLITMELYIFQEIH